MLVILKTIVVFCFPAFANNSVNLFKTTGPIYGIELRFKGTLTSSLMKKDPELDKFLAEIAEEEWQKALKLKFTEQEITYLNQLFANQLLKRFNDFNNDFTNSKGINEILNEKLKNKEIQIVVNRKTKK